MRSLLLAYRYILKEFKIYGEEKFFVLDSKSEKRDDEGIRYKVLNETRKNEKQGAMEYAYHV